MKKVVKSLKRGFLIEKMGKHSRFASALALTLLVNVFHLAVAAAPSEPIVQTNETVLEASSVAARSVLEQPYRKIVTVFVTGYSSTPDQTDDTPFITAYNTEVRDGIVAANFLPAGTEIRIPELFGDKTFVVEDRMHERFSDRIDIWFADRETAKNFGVKTATVQIL